MPGVASRLKCRGQVIESTRTVDLRGHDQGARLPARAVRDRRRPDVRRRQADRRDHRHVAAADRASTRDDLERLWAARSRDRRSRRDGPRRSTTASGSWPSRSASRRRRSASATGSSTTGGSSPGCPARRIQFLDRVTTVDGRALEDGRPGARSRPSTTSRPTPGTSPPTARTGCRSPCCWRSPCSRAAGWPPTWARP